MIENHGKLSLNPLLSATARVDQASSSQKAKVAARFLRDFMLFYRDLRRVDVLNRAMEKINLISSPKLSELSRLNGTLYDFSLPTEGSAQNREKAVVRHVILKADVRDSSRVTRSLLERDMNPASYFSLNFYEPVNQLLVKYHATKVFVEGDAIILAILEHEGDPALSVSRACVLAREMTELVGGYNHLLQRAGLPALERELDLRNVRDAERRERGAFAHEPRDVGNGRRGDAGAQKLVCQLGILVREERDRRRVILLIDEHVPVKTRSRE